MRRARSALVVFLGAVGSVVLAGCGGAEPVARLVDGRPITTRFIDSDAYDAFLRGALADASGNDREALDAFREAANDDPQAPDIWTRLGAVRCRLTPKDERADGDFLRALHLDSTFAPTYRARAVCEARRGQAAASDEDMRRADGIDAKSSATDASRRYESALALVPTVRSEAARAAERLAGAGHEAEARRLAGLAADAVNDPANGRRDPLPPLASQLAVDDAIVRGDAPLLDRRLVETRTSVDDAAARARTLHHPELATRLETRKRAADGT